MNGGFKKPFGPGASKKPSNGGFASKKPMNSPGGFNRTPNGGGFNQRPTGPPNGGGFNQRPMSGGFQKPRPGGFAKPFGNSQSAPQSPVNRQRASSFSKPFGSAPQSPVTRPRASSVSFGGPGGFKKPFGSSNLAKNNLSNAALQQQQNGSVFANNNGSAFANLNANANTNVNANTNANFNTPCVSSNQTNSLPNNKPSVPALPVIKGNVNGFSFTSRKRKNSISASDANDKEKKSKDQLGNAVISNPKPKSKTHLQEVLDHDLSITNNSGDKKMSTLVDMGINCVIINFENTIALDTKGAVIVSKKNPFKYHDKKTGELRDLSDLMPDNDFLRKFIQYCAINKIMICMVSNYSQGAGKNFLTPYLKKNNMENDFEIINGEERMFSILSSVLTKQDLHYMQGEDFGFQFAMFNEANTKNKHKNHLIEKAIKVTQHKPHEIMYIDSDFKSISSAQMNWNSSESTQGIETKTCREMGFNSENLGELIGIQSNYKKKFLIVFDQIR